MLPHTATRVDRRPSLELVPFQDVYFIELLENVDDNGHDIERPEVEGASQWAQRLQDGVRRINDGGGCAQVLGIW